MFSPVRSKAFIFVPANPCIMPATRNPLSICLMAIFLLPCFSNAQKYSVHQSDAVLDDYLHEVFPAPSGYIVVNYAAPHSAFSANRKPIGFVNGYDAQLKQTFTTPFNLVDKEYEAGLFVSGKVYIFAIDEQRNIHRITLDAANGSVIGSPERIFSVPGKVTRIFKGCSADSSLFYLVYRNHEPGEKTESLHGAIMDRQMNVITKLSATFEEQPEEIMKLECILANDGALSIVTPSKNKTSKDEYIPIKYSIKQFDKTGKPTTTLLYNLPSGLLANTSWEESAAGLSFTGLLSPDKKTGYTSIVSGTFDNKQRKIVDVKKLEIAQAGFVQQAEEPYMKEIIKKGISKGVVLSANFRLGNGSHILVLEENEGQLDSHTFFSFDARANRTSVSTTSEMLYKTGNIYLIKLDANNGLQWLRCAGKNQIEAGWNNFTGIVTLRDDKDRVHIFFLDHLRNKQLEPGKSDRTYTEDYQNDAGLASIMVDKDGNIKKEFIAENRAFKHYFSPRRSIVLNNGVIYTAYRERNLGKSTYTLSSIIIN